MGRHRTIQIDEDPAFQRKNWQVERCGWAVLALLLTAALLGMFGSGPFSSVEVTEGTLTVAYPRVLRHQAPASLILTFSHDGGPVRLHLGRDWLTHVDLERVTPSPDTTLLRNDGLVLVFLTDPSARGGEVRLDFRADGVGRLDGAVGMDGGPRLHIRSFIRSFVFP